VAQLWRTHLLAVLTSTHSLNLVVAQLPEQPAWRRFARLRRTLPTTRMLHEFRQAVGVDGLRAINQLLVDRLLYRQDVQPNAVALMDAPHFHQMTFGTASKSTTYGRWVLVGGDATNGVSHVDASKGVRSIDTNQNTAKKTR
jgi:hypothetical protein